jgi:hypothetical protein
MKARQVGATINRAPSGLLDVVCINRPRPTAVASNRSAGPKGPGFSFGAYLNEFPEVAADRHGALASGSYGNEIGNATSAGYSVVGTGDFNGDGTTALLLQNSSGNLVDWTINNGTFAGGNEIGDPASAGYSVVGTGDFNGGGTSDLLQSGSGNLVDWTMKNGTLSGGSNINNPTLYGYHLA